MLGDSAGGSGSNLASKDSGASSLVDPAFPDFDGDWARKSASDSTDQPKGLPWERSTLASSSARYDKILFVLGTVSVAIVALIIGLSVGLTRGSKGDDNSGENSSMSAFLNSYAAFHGMERIVSSSNLKESLGEDFEISNDDANLPINPDAPVFYTGGEMIKIRVSPVVGHSFGVVFGDFNHKSKLNIVRASEGMVKIVLPTTCPQEESQHCAEFDLHIALLDNEGRALLGQASTRIGFTCTVSDIPRVDCNTCGSTSLCAGGKTLAPEMSLCVDRFGIRNKVLFTKPSDCFTLEILESVVQSCADALGLTLEEALTDHLSLPPGPDTCESYCTSIDCHSAVTRFRLHTTIVKTGAPVAATDAPSSSPGTPTTITLPPSSTDSTPRPTYATPHPTAARTRSPTNQIVCSELCTCPDIDPCCCEDGFCAPETCPYNYNL